MTPATPRRPRPGVVGLSRTAGGSPVPLAHLRVWGRLSRLDDRWWGWLGPIAVTLLAFGMRIWHLGTPHEFAFDETYYAKDAWSMLNNGFDQNYQATVANQPINDAILSGHTTGIFAPGPSMIVHPEVGKWLIALGEKTFGMDPFGWRIAACVVGSLLVLVLCRLTRRLTGSTLLGCVAGLLMAFDGLEFVLSRLALLDIFGAFFLVCGVACVVNDRDWSRRRISRLLERDAQRDPDSGDDRAAGPAEVVVRAHGWGPVRALLWRPWLVTAGVAFGLACGTKWDAVYPLAAFGVLTFVWSAGARRSVGVTWSLLRAALVDGVPAFLQLVLVALVVYVASWTGWLIHHHQYEEYLSANPYRQFVSMQGCDSSGNPIVTSDDTKKWPTADEHATGVEGAVDALRSLWYYHQDVYVFHTHFLNCATHPYASKPSGWPLLNRPVGVATDLTVKPGTEGCTAAADQVCYREVLLLGTPLLWWGGALALIAAGVLWVGTRDWRWGVTVVGALSTWLPWLQYAQRPIFSFYAISYLPFAVMAVAMVMGKLIGRDRTPTARRTVGVVVAGSFFVLVLANFAYFYPIYSYQVLPRPDWVDRMWFARWI